MPTNMILLECQANAHNGSFTLELNVQNPCHTTLQATRISWSESLSWPFHHPCLFNLVLYMESFSYLELPQAWYINISQASVMFPIIILVLFKLWKAWWQLQCSINSLSISRRATSPPIKHGIPNTRLCSTYTLQDAFHWRESTIIFNICNNCRIYEEAINKYGARNASTCSNNGLQGIQERTEAGPKKDMLFIVAPQ